MCLATTTGPSSNLDQELEVGSVFYLHMHIHIKSNRLSII